MSPHCDHENLFRSWLREHGGILARIARSYASTASGIADLEQEMTLQLWTSVDSYRGHCAASTWIYRVCLNTALTWRRDNERHGRHLDPCADVAAMASSGASPAENAAERDLLERLYRAIHTMPKIDRALVLLSLEGLAYREISEVTGMTENHVGVALNRARKQLAQLMKGVADELE